MKSKIYLASPHMSDEGYEKEYVKEAFDSNWVAPLGPNVNNFELEIAKGTMFHLYRIDINKEVLQ